MSFTATLFQELGCLSYLLIRDGNHLGD